MFLLMVPALAWGKSNIIRTAAKPNKEAGYMISARLLTPVSSYSSKVADEVQAVVLAPVLDQGRVLIPRNSTIYGHIRAVRRVGTGLWRERAMLDIAFPEWRHPDGSMHTLGARLVAVENAREEVTSHGVVKGILAAGGMPGFLNGVWSRPTTSMFARTSVGMVGVTHFAVEHFDFHPIATVGLPLLRMALVSFPEPEIYFPRGTDLLLKLDQAPPDLPPGPRLIRRPDDPELAEYVDSLPVRAVFLNSRRPSDPVNLVLLGSRLEVEQAFAAAGWSATEALTGQSFLRSYQAMTRQVAYHSAPMSTMLLDDKVPDLMFQRSLNTFAKRHHIRIWKADTLYKGREVWLGAATHDIGIQMKGATKFTHRIDPLIDRERRTVVEHLRFAGCTSDVQMVARRQLAELDLRHMETDGRAAVLSLRACAPSASNAAWIDSSLGPRPAAPARIFRRFALEMRYSILRGNAYYWGFRAITARRRPYLPSQAPIDESLAEPLTDQK
jgi:hypothetical protein